jgi:hypothetical protein
MAAVTAEACVATEVPRRYLAQLCKHFQHKLPVELTETRGQVAFPMGSCTLDAEAVPGVLLMRATAADEEALVTVQGIVARHLERFAFREALTVAWLRTP